MATHSSICTWKIPWTEESDRLQSMGLQKSGQDLATKENNKTKTLSPPSRPKNIEINIQHITVSYRHRISRTYPFCIIETILLSASVSSTILVSICKILQYLSFSDLFHLAQYPPGQFMLSQMAGSPFLALNISLYEYVSF